MYADFNGGFPDWMVCAWEYAEQPLSRETVWQGCFLRWRSFMILKNAGHQSVEPPHCIWQMRAVVPNWKAKTISVPTKASVCLFCILNKVELTKGSLCSHYCVCIILCQKNINQPQTLLYWQGYLRPPVRNSTWGGLLIVSGMLWSVVKIHLFWMMILFTTVFALHTYTIFKSPSKT